MALGATVSLQGDPAPLIADFTQRIGKAPALWTIASRWGQEATKAFPTARTQAVVDAGATPLIWWIPTNPSRPESSRYSYANISKGKRDGYIRAWAQDAAAFGHTVIVRFAHEANGTWFPWCVGCFDNTLKNYKRAWRRVVRLVREEGASNVRFLWSVAIHKCAGCNPYKRFYPGDGVVDYVGFSAFNWGSFEGRGWKSLVRAYARPMADLRAITSKPVIVAETASHFKGGDKAKWIRAGYKAAYDRWPKLKAIVYLDTKTSGGFVRHPDWRLVKPADGSAKDAYAEIAALERFQGTIP
jgi:mannan endo-1,4-beta-mannosidase